MSDPRPALPPSPPARIDFRRYRKLRRFVASVFLHALWWDLLLNRLDCYFLPSTTGAGDDRVEHVARLAKSLLAAYRAWGK